MIFLIAIKIIITSPEGKYENDDTVINFCTFLYKIQANIVII